MNAPAPELQPAFDVYRPKGGCRVPFVFNSPHSGATYPAGFVASSRLDIDGLRRSEDAFVDELFDCATAHGASMMRARFPRAYIDVNREPYELDPRMFDGALPRHANTRSMRVAGGLGTVARVVADSEPIYPGRIPVCEAIRRIEHYYLPYHANLRQLIGETQRRFGVVVLIDCHSMPSQKIACDDRAKPDFVLGDRYSTSCAPELADRVQETLVALGYTVGRNKPYAGGYITERYGNPPAATHALQIEINRGLYMDERRYRRTGGFAWLKADIERLVGTLTDMDLGDFLPPAIAAE